MKVLYFGSDVFLSCFEYLLQSHEILALYTYHREEDYFTEYAIAAEARAHGIPVHYESVTAQALDRFFRQDGCDLLFIAEYDRVLPIPTGLSNFRAINTHSSLLPQGRSYYPIEAAMTQGLPRSGVTMHKLTRELDRGDILAQRSFAISPEMDSIDVYLTCAACAREMLADILDDFDTVWCGAQPQAVLSPYWPRPGQEKLTLLPDMTRREALAVFRCCNSTTQVFVHGVWYHVTALSEGIAPVRTPQFLSPGRLLYPVKDGHLRLHVHPMEVTA